MARIVTGALTTFNLSTHLDPQTLDLYGVRELISTPAYGAFSAYTANNEKGAIDASFNFTWTGGNLRAGGAASILVVGTGALGYATGAGGTVTQATNKATAVTLNKANGEITLNAASLAAGSSVGFSLINSLIQPADHLFVSLKNGSGTGGAYLIQSQVDSGAAAIYVRNLTGGPLAEAIVIKFALIKGSTS